MNHSRAIRGHSVHYGTAPWIGKGISLVERHWRLLATVYSVIVLGIIVACGITGSFGIDQFYAHHWPLAVFKLLTLGAGGIWWFVDVVLWMVGGVYGTPGCPGGSEHSWQY
ncbi:hypothetical protein DER44DRAFT_754509 [Fusarium oxysporum]|nr:hypothetical protein DER44DRAFT_754509 [Fusarium oxysporum]